MVALFTDQRNGGYVDVDIDLKAKTLTPVTDEGGNYQVTYLGRSYVIAMSTKGSDGRLTEIFTNFDSQQVAQRAIYNTQVTMSFYTGEEDEHGNKLTTMRIVMADIVLDESVPTETDSFNNGGSKAFDYSLETSPEEQGATEFKVTVTVKDGAGNEFVTVELPLYFGYNGSAQSSANA